MNAFFVISIICLVLIIVALGGKNYGFAGFCTAVGLLYFIGGFLI